MIDLFKGGKIYFFQSGRSGPIKIGFTTNIMKRYTALQLATYMELRLRALTVGTRQLEKELLAKFKEDRIRGEWFQPSLALTSYINSIDSVGVKIFDNYQFRRIPHPGYAEVDEKYVCRLCCNILDGKFGEAISGHKNLKRPDLHKRGCLHCKKQHGVLRTGLCKTCYTFKMRTGKERPLIAPKKICVNCNKELSAYAGKKRCWTCYVYLRRMKKDRSQELILRANS